MFVKVFVFQESAAVVGRFGTFCLTSVYLCDGALYLLCAESFLIQVVFAAVSNDQMFLECSLIGQAFLIESVFGVFVEIYFPKILKSCAPCVRVVFQSWPQLPSVGVGCKILIVRAQLLERLHGDEVAVFGYVEPPVVS